MPWRAAQEYPFEPQKQIRNRHSMCQCQTCDTSDHTKTGSIVRSKMVLELQARRVANNRGEPLFSWRLEPWSKEEGGLTKAKESWT